MGVAIAWPQTLGLDRLVIDRVGSLYRQRESTLPSEKPPFLTLEEQSNLPLHIRVIDWLKYFPFKAWKFFIKVSNNVLPSETRGPWTIARARPNTMMLAQFRCETSNTSICVSNYHMPCYFMVPDVMLIHAALYVKNVQRLANG